MACFYILESSKKDSKFEKFFKIMPSSFEEFPVMYSDEEMDWIKGSNLFHHVLK